MRDNLRELPESPTRVDEITSRLSLALADDLSARRVKDSVALMSSTIRRAEPSDYEAVRQVYAGPKAIWGTLQSPFSSLEQWRKRMAEPPEGLVSLVACVESELEVYTDNEPAIQLYKKFGFTIESTLAQFAFRVGNMSIAPQWHDSDKWKAGMIGNSSDAVFDNFL